MTLPKIVTALYLLERHMNFKNMTYREITRLISTFNDFGDIDEATRHLDDLIESLKIIRSMLEGRKALQIQKEKLQRRRGLKVVVKDNRRRS